MFFFTVSFCSGGVSVYDVTSSLPDWSHVPSIAGVSLSGGLYPPGSLSTGVTVKGVPPRTENSPPYGNERTVRILLEYFLVSRYYVFQNFVLLRLKKIARMMRCTPMEYNTARSRSRLTSY